MSNFRLQIETLTLREWQKRLGMKIPELKSKKIKKKWTKQPSNYWNKWKRKKTWKINGKEKTHGKKKNG